MTLPNQLAASYFLSAQKVRRRYRSPLPALRLGQEEQAAVRRFEVIFPEHELRTRVPGK